MADWYGVMSKTSGGGGRSRRNEDFEEEDVWGFVKEREDSSPKMRKSDYSSGSSSAWRLPTAPRIIPRANAPKNHETKVTQQSSAPVNIPDWSKIYGKNAKLGSKKNGSWVDDGDDDGDCHGVDEDDDDDDGDMVPPHEWIARKLARNQISSSVCEGIGRTLKGRDLSKVRNAILTKTGFLE